MGGVERRVRRVVRRRARRRRAATAAGGAHATRAARRRVIRRARPSSRALVTSQRSLFEVARDRSKGAIELLDLLGGAEFARRRATRAASASRSATSPSCGWSASRGEVRFGRTFIYHPKAARAAIVERARGDAREGRVAARRDRSDRAAARPGHALPPHGAGARLRARLADHGMKRRARRRCSCSCSRWRASSMPTLRRRARAFELDREAAAAGAGGARLRRWRARSRLGAARAARLSRSSRSGCTRPRRNLSGRASRRRSRSAARSRSADAVVVDAHAVHRTQSAIASRPRRHHAARSLGARRPSPRCAVRLSPNATCSVFVRGELTRDRRRSRLRRRSLVDGRVDADRPVHACRRNIIHPRSPVASAFAARRSLSRIDSSATSCSVASASSWRCRRCGRCGVTPDLASS